MKKILYLLILILLPCGGMIRTGNAESKHSDTNSQKADLGVLAAIVNQNERGVRDLNSGGISMEDPQ